MPQTEYAIQLEHVTKTFGPVIANHDVTMNIRRGEILSLLGENGSGKTTLMNMIAGIYYPDGGQIIVNGQPADIRSPRDALALGIGMIHQHFKLVDVFTAVENIALSMDKGEKFDLRRVRDKARAICEKYQFALDLDQKVYEMSVSQKQTLEIVKVLFRGADILILDEPTSQLDPIAASDFLNTLRKINAELGTTILITEHRVEDIFPYADRAIVMDGGKVIANDTPRNIGKRLWEEKNDMFTAMPTPVRVFYGSGGAGECPLTVREGRNWLSDIFPNPPEITELPAQPQTEEDGEIALSLKELWFRYEKNSPDVLRGASVEVAKGSLHAIVGGNGAGKSTTLKAVCGICRPYRGKVKVLGKPVEKYKQQELFRGCLAMLPQDPKSLFVKKTVLEDLQEMTQNEQDIRETAEICQITSLLKSHPYDLSGGEQQRAALAKVLLTRPQLLLLDEPTKGIDSFFKETFASILTELKKKGITIVMVSHDVEFCARYADQVSMFFDGQVLTTDTPRRFFGANSFYTTAANRMSRHVFRNAVTAEDVVDLYKQNRETKA